jgi:Ala-tRNA(Pro) deacylase
MAIAGTLRAFLDERGAAYELMPHAPASTSSETAESAHVPGHALAKAVVLEDADHPHYAVVVLPATEQLNLGELRRRLGDTYALATEEGLSHIFADCDVGSVPPFGQAYGLEVMVDDTLLEEPRVFAEGGDRAALMVFEAQEFARLMKDARHGRYGLKQERVRHGP